MRFQNVSPGRTAVPRSRGRAGTAPGAAPPLDTGLTACCHTADINFPTLQAQLSSRRPRARQPSFAMRRPVRAGHPPLPGPGGPAPLSGRAEAESPHDAPEPQTTHDQRPGHRRRGHLGQAAGPRPRRPPRAWWHGRAPGATTPPTPLPLQPDGFPAAATRRVTAGGWLATQLGYQLNGLIRPVRPRSRTSSQFDDTGWVHPDLGGWEEVPVLAASGFSSLAIVTGDTRVQTETARWINGGPHHPGSGRLLRPDRRCVPVARTAARTSGRSCRCSRRIRSYAEYTGDNRIIPFLSRFFRYMNAQGPGAFDTELEQPALGRQPGQSSSGSSTAPATPSCSTSPARSTRTRAD